MAMTAQDILTAAYSHAKKLQPNVTLVDATEAPSVINRALKGLTLFGIQINPVYFGAEPVDVPYVAPGWKRPADALMMLHLANADGEPVTIVQYAERNRFLNVPAVWQWGQVYRPTGGAGGPAAGEALTMLYARTPATVAALANELDALWPDDFSELLALEVAIYATLKDERPDAYLAALRAERDRWALRFVAFLDAYAGNVTIVNDPEVPAGERIAAAAALLAGGSSLASAGG